MKMGKKGKHAISSSFSQVFSFSWISKIKRMAGKSSAALPSAEPVKRNCSKPPAAPTNSSESSPCRLQPGRFSESGRPMCSVTNFAYSPEVLDKRTGLRVAGAVEAEEDFWRFSFRRQSFEWERYAHPPGEDRGRRAFSVDFESGPHFRQSGKPEAEEAKEQPKNQNFPPLNLKRPDHQKFKDSKPRRKCTPQRSPVRGDLFSPRTICKIRAVEEMKRRRRKKEGKRRPGLEGFAVVKKSWDPQRDFRESMVEMISEKKMGGGEELEKLLACYLELNPAEFHDLIIKVFRQVWFDLNRDSGLGASELEQGYFDY